MDAFAKKHAVYFVELLSLFRYGYCFHGNNLCLKGDPANSFWLVQSGALEVWARAVFFPSN